MADYKDELIMELQDQLKEAESKKDTDNSKIVEKLRTENLKYRQQVAELEKDLQEHKKREAKQYGPAVPEDAFNPNSEKYNLTSIGREWRRNPERAEKLLKKYGNHKWLEYMRGNN